MFQKKQIFQLNILKKLLSEENGCVSLIPTRRSIALPPCFLTDVKRGIFYTLNNALKKYDQTLDGILMGYQNVKILMDDRTGLIPMGVADISVNISVEFYVFQPKINGYLQGTVNKKSNEHIGCLVHKYFNATILKPDNVDFDSWNCRNINENDTIKFRVTDLDFTGVLPRIEGTIDNSENDTCDDHDGPSFDDSNHGNSNELKKNDSNVNKNNVSKDSSREIDLLQSEEFWSKKLQGSYLTPEINNVHLDSKVNSKKRKLAAASESEQNSESDSDNGNNNSKQITKRKIRKKLSEGFDTSSSTPKTTEDVNNVHYTSKHALEGKEESGKDITIANDELEEEKESVKKKKKKKKNKEHKVRDEISKSEKLNIDINQKDSSTDDEIEEQIKSKLSKDKNAKENLKKVKTKFNNSKKEDKIVLDDAEHEDGAKQNEKPTLPNEESKKKTKAKKKSRDKMRENSLKNSDGNADQLEVKGTKPKTPTNLLLSQKKTKDLEEKEEATVESLLAETMKIYGTSGSKKNKSDKSKKEKVADGEKLAWDSTFTKKKKFEETLSDQIEFKPTCLSIAQSSTPITGQNNSTKRLKHKRNRSESESESTLGGRKAKKMKVEDTEKTEANSGGGEEEEVDFLCSKLLQDAMSSINVRKDSTKASKKGDKLPGQNKQPEKSKNEKRSEEAFDGNLSTGSISKKHNKNKKKKKKKKKVDEYEATISAMLSKFMAKCETKLKNGTDEKDREKKKKKKSKKEKGDGKVS